jgi:ferredoxin
MRVCPTQAIRVRRKQAHMLEDRCIDCGECLKVCTKGAIVPLTETLADLSKFDCTVAVPSPALYTQFDAEVPPGVILEALKWCGFDDAATLSWACGAVTVAIEQFLTEFDGEYPLISSFCPTVVRLIQEKYPDLIKHLLPVLAPREVAAREGKARKARDTGLPLDRIGAVYVTPCPAKMVSIVDHPGMEKSHIDSAVSISDLYRLLWTAVRRVNDAGVTPGEAEFSPGLGWAFSTGLPSSLPAEDTMCVAGLPNVLRMLDDIEKGKLRRYAFIECHACPEGCVSGALTVENPYVARARAIHLRQSLGEDRSFDRDEVIARYRTGEFLMPVAISPRPLISVDTDIGRAITRMKERERILLSLPGIDCGACGAPSCEAFADDVIRGDAEEEACVFVRQCHIEALVDELASVLRAQARARRPAGGSS